MVFTARGRNRLTVWVAASLLAAGEIFIGVDYFRGGATAEISQGEKLVIFLILAVLSVITWIALLKELVFAIHGSATRLYLEGKRRSQQTLELKLNRYKILEKSRREIRLIEILPAERPEPVECRLRPVSLDELDEVVPYEALSYSWGSAFQTHGILLNGEPCEVRKNLYHALIQLRDAETSRFLWIDALSINQFDIIERNEQVQMMRHIYQNASNVLVWLGESDKDSETALQFLGEVESRADKTSFVRRSIGHKTYIDAWRALRTLLAKPYWERVWIIQEIAVAKTLVVQCGSGVIEWNTLVLCDDMWQSERISMAGKRARWFGAVDDQEIGPLRILSHSPGPAMLNITRSIFFNGPRSKDSREEGLAKLPLRENTILELAQVYWASKATDRKDRIYPLVGLASDCKDPNFPIDYNLHTGEIHQNLVSYLNKKTGRMDVLGYSGLCASESDEKTYWLTKEGSWLPTWNSAVASKAQLANINVADKYAAAGTTTANVRFEKGFMSSNRIHISGYRVGLVHSICPTSSDFGNSFIPKSHLQKVTGDIRAYYAYACQALSEVEAQGLEGNIEAKIRWSQHLQKNKDEFWRVLVCDRTIQGEKAPSEWKAQFDAILGDKTLEQENKNSEQDREVEAFVRPYQLAVLYYMNTPQLFVTTDGNFGVGPRTLDKATAHEKDDVLVLCGCNVPMVLGKSWKQVEQQNEDFSEEKGVDHLSKALKQQKIWVRQPLNDFFRGWAYLQNYMNGEAIEEATNQPGSLEIFSLE